MLVRRLLLAAAWLAVSWTLSLGSVRILRGADLEEDLENPYTSEEDMRRGALFIRAYCSVCHGPEGKGGRGPNLLDDTFRNGSSNRAILKNIKEGVSGTDMPAFDVDDEMIWPIITYIRSQKLAEERPTGDPKRGAEIFLKHQCSNCHWIGTDGGRRGPDLSKSAGPLSYIRESIVDPDANFRQAPAFQHNRFQRVAVVDAQGLTHEGRWMNENAAFIQMIDGDERLLTIAKEEDVFVFKPRQSLMPPDFADEIRQEDLEHLIAYVYSLRPNTSEAKGAE